ncbi:MAG TPA: ribbon-helix-helix protein, CopG family [Anaerolineae bacterium]|nr:ribbon-helix-helix protein, CopG family [Anaerolineae bacterium]
MATTRIAVSLPPDLLAQVDELAQRLNESRSAIVRRSLEQTLEQYALQRTLHKAGEIYAEIEEADRQLAEDFLTISAETLPPYEAEP